MADKSLSPIHPDSKPICMVADCGRPRRRYGYCEMHSQRFKRHGDPNQGERRRNFCCVDECSLPVHGKGYCKKHYLRLWRHGSPAGGQQTFRGEVLAFIEAAIASDTNDCILFPYGDSNGYAQFTKGNEHYRGHAYVAERVHGEKPSPDHMCCHECGNSYCVNPKHLYWGTKLDNWNDSVRHGTAWAFGKKV